MKTSIVIFFPAAIFWQKYKKHKKESFDFETYFFKKISPYNNEAIRKTKTKIDTRYYGCSPQDLLAQAGRRQAELKDPLARDELAAARAVLKKHSMMLLTASKAYVRHPELAAARENRDYVLRQVCEAVNTISDVAKGGGGQGGRPSGLELLEGQGELAAALDDFDARVIMNPLTYDDAKMRPSLEEVPLVFYFCCC
jgi:hypothetical protein